MRQTIKIGSIFVIILLLSSCTYKGNIRSDFYKPAVSQNKLPIKAYFVWDSALDSGKYVVKNMMGNYDAEIGSAPGLKLAFINAIEGVFENLQVVDKIDDAELKKYDILILPKFELRSDAVYIQLTVKDAKTADLLDKYEASGNVPFNYPLSAYVLTFLNVIPCGLLCSPIILPSITHILGKQLESDYEQRIIETLNSIMRDIKNDRKLTLKYNSAATSSLSPQ
jgi:hypothetical protein